MPGAGARPVPRLDLTAIRNEATQCGHILIVYFVHSTEAEGASLGLGDISSLLSPNHVVACRYRLEWQVFWLHLFLRA